MEAAMNSLLATPKQAQTGAASLTGDLFSIDSGKISLKGTDNDSFSGMLKEKMGSKEASHNDRERNELPAGGKDDSSIAEKRNESINEGKEQQAKERQESTEQREEQKTADQRSSEEGDSEKNSNQESKEESEKRADSEGPESDEASVDDADAEEVLLGELLATEEPPAVEEPPTAEETMLAIQQPASEIVAPQVAAAPRFSTWEAFPPSWAPGAKLIRDMGPDKASSAPIRNTCTVNCGIADLSSRRMCQRPTILLAAA